MHLTIEKTLGIAISLTLIASIGIPLFNLAFDTFSMYQQQEGIIEFMNLIDSDINFVLNKKTHLLDQITIITPIDLWSENDTVYCRNQNDDAVLTYEYPINIVILTPPISVGEYLVYFRIENNSLTIEFELTAKT